MEPVTAAVVCIAIASVILVVIRKYAMSGSHRQSKPACTDAIVTPEVLSKLRNEFHVRAQDVFVATHPKSGTTWTQQIVRLVLTAHGSLPADKDGNLVDVSPWLEGLHFPVAGSSTDMTYSEIDALPSPRTLKTHMPYDSTPGGPPHTSPAKYIYVARNPKDTFVSLFFFLCDMNVKGGKGRLPWRMLFESYVNGTGYNGISYFGCWYDHVLGWWKQRDRPNVLFLKYEDMQKDLPGVVREVADFLGCGQMEPEVINSIVEKCTFRNMQRDPKRNFSWVSKNHMRGATEALPSPGIWILIKVKILLWLESSRFAKATGDQLVMMRRGVVGDWKEYLMKEESDKIDRFWVTKLRNHGLDFDFEL